MIDQMMPRWVVPHARELGALVEAPAVEVLEVLQKTRKTIAGGWSEPFTRDSEGTWCLPTDEGATTFSTIDALALAGGTFEAQTLAEWELMIAIDPTFQTTLSPWFTAEGRKVTEVLAVFDRAISRVKAATRTETSNVA